MNSALNDLLPSSARDKASDPAFAVTLSAWRKFIADRQSIGLPDLQLFDPGDINFQDELSIDDRLLILNQAKILIANFYPHLPYKKEDFPTGDALSALDDIVSLLQSDQAWTASGLAFHNELFTAVGSVRDPHTAYIATAALQNALSFLPFRVGCYTGEDKEDHYIVTDVMPHDVPDTDFVPGVELISSSLTVDGQRITIDIATQIEDAAALSPGANQASETLRGLQRLTVRPLATCGNQAIDQLAESGELAFQYIPSPGAPPKDFHTAWVVATATGIGQSFPPGAISMARDLCDSHYATSALFNRQFNRAMYGGSSLAAASDPNTMSVFPDVFEFQHPQGSPDHCDVPPELLRLDGSERKFGYIAIKRFFSPNVKLSAERELTDEFERILRVMNTVAPDGLLLDIRSNPGGEIRAAEKMLALLTPRLVTPASFHMANTQPVLDILAAVKQQTDADSTLKAFAATAPTVPYDPADDRKAPRITPGHPLTATPDAPAQVYQGAIVLLIDALTYSAADIFAGGFQDHSVGKILGWDEQTGGGGASVYSLKDLAAIFPKVNHGLVASLPGHASLNLAFLRSSRVGANAGVPIEDLGVKADKVQRRTLFDLRDRGKDFIAAAVSFLGTLPSYRVVLDLAPSVAVDGVHVNVTTTPGISLLDFYLEEGLVLKGQIAIPGQPQTFVVPYPPQSLLSVNNPPMRLRVDGFLESGDIGAVTRFSFPRPVQKVHWD